jgi:hypothetical protein
VVIAVFIVYLTTSSVAHILGVNDKFIAGKLIGKDEEVNIRGVT